MAAATDYTRENFLEAIFKGQDFKQPSGLYIALHTSSPGTSGRNNEVSTSRWPSYQRVDAANNEALTDGWTSVQNNEVSNAKQLPFVSYDGTSDLTITHLTIWDARSGGNCLFFAQLAAPRTISPNDVFVVDTNRYEVQVL